MDDQGRAVLRHRSTRLQSRPLNNIAILPPITVYEQSVYSTKILGLLLGRAIRVVTEV